MTNCATAQYGHTTWYRHLAAFGGVLNVLMMMTANLIGFAIGTEGMSYMWQQVIGSAQGQSFPVLCARKRQEGMKDCTEADDDGKRRFASLRT